MPRLPRFTTLLTATTVGVYLLVVVGATTALADAVAACGTWPLCSGPLTDPQVAVATGHRVAAAVVGVLLLATVAVGWSMAPRRVRAALGVALALYPVQVAVGAFVAVAGAPSLLAGAHLLAAVAIFASLALALAWQLEAETGHRPPATTEAAGTLSATDDTPAPDPAGTPTPLSQRGPVARARATLYAYFKLMKPRLMWLLCLVAGAAMALAAGPDLRVDTIAYTLGGGVLAIGASGTFNHVLERDVDQKMARTADRPLATHQVPVRNALVFGGLLTVAAVAVFLQVNTLVAGLGFAAIVFYSVVYTLVLKPNTVQNTVIGGAAGALPALIGWAAATGEVGLAGLALAGVIFLWTPAHFYNLALAYKEDYARGGFPMMPVVRGETETRKHIVFYLAATLVAASVLTALTGLGWLFASATVTFGALFLWMVVRLHRERTKGAALRAFHASNAYLGALLVAVLVDAIAL
ncbi:heme o synthase [Halomarina ordinaria]|uniref:Protoheme IX farnesyltransferase n=1 Tax=Halomarina ordinaria TaxID=3033939 RepID=A0ABD5UAU2_9EURY|nr:heme o synthase [Halomarina sp. PSRA2]